MKHKFSVFEEKMLGKIFQPNREKVTGESRKFVSYCSRCKIIRMVRKGGRWM
jgi:hypothetical protein